LPKTKAYLLSNYFNDDAKIFVHAGIPKTQQLSRPELEQFAADYEEFVANNIDRINMFSELTHPSLSQEFIESQRKTCWSQVPPAKFLPIWDVTTDRKGLQDLASKYLDIGITGENVDNVTWLASETRNLQRTHGTRFHAIACAKPDNLRSILFESAATLAWLSPMTHGETIIWDGTRLVRYPKKMTEQASHR